MRSLLTSSRFNGTGARAGFGVVALAMAALALAVLATIAPGVAASASTALRPSALGGPADADAAQPGAPADEPDPTLKASAILTPAQLKGPNHTVAEAATTPGFFHVFSVTSTFGTFEAEGTSQVAARMREIAALAALHEVSKTEVFVKAAGASVVKAGTGVVNAVSSPVDTAKGIGGGLKRVGVNLGRRTQRAAEDVTADDKPESAESGGARTRPRERPRAWSASTARCAGWAKKVGADPYTTNPALREALEGVAKVDVAGGLAAKIAVPIPAVVGTTAQVGDLVWGRDPEELRKLNEQRAREIGASADGAKAFFRSQRFTLTMQTRIIAALHAVRVPGPATTLPRPPRPTAPARRCSSSRVPRCSRRSTRRRRSRRCSPIRGHWWPSCRRARPSPSCRSIGCGSRPRPPRSSARWRVARNRSWAPPRSGSTSAGSSPTRQRHRWTRWAGGADRGPH